MAPAVTKIQAPTQLLPRARVHKFITPKRQDLSLWVVHITGEGSLSGLGFIQSGCGLSLQFEPPESKAWRAMREFAPFCFFPCLASRALAPLLLEEPYSYDGA